MIFNVLTMLMHVVAHTGTVRESALKVNSGRKISCRTGESNRPQWRAGPTLYQLSYIPILVGMCVSYTQKIGYLCVVN